MSELDVRDDGKVRRLVINREDKRNSLSRDVLSGLLEGVRTAAADDAVTVVVVSSTGDKVFTMGDNGGASYARSV